MSNMSISGLSIKWIGPPRDYPGFTFCHGLVLIDFSQNLWDCQRACEETLTDMCKHITVTIIKNVKCHLNILHFADALFCWPACFFMIIPSLRWPLYRHLLDWYVLIFSFVVSMQFKSCDDLLDVVYVPSFCIVQWGEWWMFSRLSVGTGQGPKATTGKLLRT